MWITATSYACDLCSIYVGIKPDDYKNSIGFIHRYRSFEKTYQASFYSNTLDKHGEQFSLKDYKLAERYNSYDLTLKYFINPAWQINAIVSFSDNYFVKDDSLEASVAGPGDLLFLIKHQIYNSRKCDDSSNWVKRFSAAAGIKLPTGKYDKTYVEMPTKGKNVVYGQAEEVLDPHLQAGTGSVDFIFLVEGIVMYKDLGVNVNVSYKANTINKNNFRFSNRFNLNPSLFYVKQFENFRVMPMFGAAFEMSKRDKLNGEDYLASGGETLFGNAGLSIFYKKLMLSTTYFNPIYQNLNDNQLNNKMRWITELNYFF